MSERVSPGFDHFSKMDHSWFRKMENGETTIPEDSADPRLMPAIQAALNVCVPDFASVDAAHIELPIFVTQDFSELPRDHINQQYGDKLTQVGLVRVVKAVLEGADRMRT